MIKEKINFHIGGLFEKHELLKLFLQIFKDENYKFYPYVRIGSLFGCINCKWNGGRLISDYYDIDTAEVAEFMKIHYPDIQCRLTFTNMLINNQSLYDEVGNRLLKEFNFGHNAVIIYSDLLENYIRTNYPNYAIVSSVTKCLSQEETCSELTKNDYHMVVINSNYVQDYEFIKSLPNKDKIELMINDACGIYCSNRKEHYLEYSRCQLSHKHPYHCIHENGPSPFFDLKKKPLFISNEDITNKYYPLGIYNYKIQGRTNFHIDYVETLMYYLVKPEFQLEIRERLLLKEMY